MSLPDWLDRRTAAVAFLLVALPGWLLVAGAPHYVWANATATLLDGGSLYQLKPTDWNPHSTRYVYLPIFGMATAAMAAVPIAVGTVLEWSTPLMDGIAVAVAGLWGYIGYAALAYATLAYAVERGLSRRRQALAVALVAGFPMVFIRATYAGSELVVAALLLATAVAWRRERYVDTGLFVSLATFKFTALPALAAVVLLAAVTRTRRETALVVLGAAAGQLPNLAYFAKFPEDLAMIVANKGALSTYAYRITAHHTLLRPVAWLDATGWYVDVALPAVVLAFTLAAVVVARRTTLLPGLLVAMFPMAYLLPAERRYLPVAVGLLVLLALRWDRQWAKLAAVAIVTVKAYVYLVEFLAPAKGRLLLDWSTQLVQSEIVLHTLVLLAVVVPMAVGRPRLSWQARL